MKIYKYPIQVGVNSLVIPGKHKIIAFGEQAGELCVWAEVDPDSTTTHKALCIVGTGWDVPPGLKHFATITEAGLNGQLVWHLYV